MVVWRHLLQKTSIFGCSENPDSLYIITGIPLDQTTTYKPGTRFAPDHIRLAACNLEFYSLITGKSLEHIGFNDLGNIIVPPDIERVYENIKTVVKGLFEEYGYEKLYFFLGGEHTITYPILSVLNQEIEQLIVFDAHTDLRNEYLGSKHNHATVMRRIFEEIQIPIIYIGVRALSEEELVFIDRNRDSIVLCDMNSIFKNECRLDVKDKIYISIDLDAVDPAYAPGVSNPEPLGLSPHNLLVYLTKIIRKANVRGIDITEVNPLVDVNDVTSLLASKIILEIIGFYEKRFK